MKWQSHWALKAVRYFSWWPALPVPLTLLLFSSIAAIRQRTRMPLGVWDGLPGSEAGGHTLISACLVLKATNGLQSKLGFVGIFHPPFFSLFPLIAFSQFHSVPLYALWFPISAAFPLEGPFPRWLYGAIVSPVPQQEQGPNQVTVRSIQLS